jgi:hypothetical protein
MALTFSDGLNEAVMLDALGKLQQLAFDLVAVAGVSRRIHPPHSLAIFASTNQFRGQLSNHFTVDQLIDSADLQFAIPFLAVHSAVHA